MVACGDESWEEEEADGEKEGEQAGGRGVKTHCRRPFETLELIIDTEQGDGKIR
jgi:hypothetical protein